MSDSIARSIMESVADIPSPIRAKLRKFTGIAITTSAAWCLTIASASWLSDRYGWSTPGHWSTLLLQGLAVIAIVCGGCFGLGVASAKSADSGSLPGGLGSIDRLEVKGFSWMVGQHQSGAAWRALAGLPSSDGSKPASNRGKEVASGERLVPDQDFSQLFDRIAPAFPSNLPIHVLIWTEKPGGAGVLDLALAARQTRNYGLTFEPLKAAEHVPGETVVEAAFKAFDTQSDLALLLICASGSDFSGAASSGTASNISLVLLARTQESVVESSGEQNKHESVESDKHDDFIKPTSLGFVYRPCRVTNSGYVSKGSLDGAIKSAWGRAAAAIPENGRIDKALLVGAGAAKLRPLVHELLQNSMLPSEEDSTILDVIDPELSTGRRQALTGFLYMLEATSESGASVAAVETTSGGVQITMASSAENCIH